MGDEMSGTVFICDDEEEILRYLGKILRAKGYAVELFSSGPSLLKRLDSDAACDVLLLDVRMPDMDGIQILKKMRKLAPVVPVIMLTAHGTIDDAVHAIKLGAFDYITKPFPKEKLLGVLEHLLDLHRLAREVKELREVMQHGTGSTGTIVFRSRSFREVYDLTLQVATSDANIIILGESGTGKELIAGAVHANSARSGKPFVSINCAALSDTLLESQLFGHMRGAFTGAVTTQKGLLEEADGGTFFLDEIGDISPAIQAKLLRVIQEKDFIPVGSTQPRRIDVRFVAATNRDLAKEVRDGRFREDLYYRLNVITLSLPPLRERKDDIEPLALHFMEHYARKMNKTMRGIEPPALERLIHYHWPGNVRELQNIIERAVILAAKESITAPLIPLAMRQHKTPSDNNLLMPLENVERRHIEAVLRETRFHKSKTAMILGISRKTLDRKIVEYGLLGPGLQ
jgi:two-component system response regulator HydG